MNSMASNDATMTLEAIESREGVETIKKIQLSQASNQIIKSSKKLQNSSSLVSQSNVTPSQQDPPLKPVKDMNMQIKLLPQVQLNEVMTTASYMKIKTKDEVHKVLQLKKGPAEIS